MAFVALELMGVVECVALVLMGGVERVSAEQPISGRVTAVPNHCTGKTVMKRRRKGKERDLSDVSREREREREGECATVRRRAEVT
jgi:hypothetical protein